MHKNVSSMTNDWSNVVESLIQVGKFDRAFELLKSNGLLGREIIRKYETDAQDSITSYEEWEFEKDPCDDNKTIARKRDVTGPGGGGTGCCSSLVSLGCCVWCCTNPESVVDCCCMPATECACDCCCGC